MKRLSGVIVVVSLWTVGACSDDSSGDGGGGSAGEGSGTGASPGSGTGASPGSGGTSTGGAAGDSGLGGMGGQVTLAEACDAWCAAASAPACANDVTEPECVTNCLGGATVGCEAEWLTMKGCESAETFECQTFSSEEHAVKSNPTACQGEVDAEFACWEATNL